MSRIRYAMLPALLACALAMTGCAASVDAQSAQPSAPDGPERIKGTVTYPDPIALMANAVVTVQLVDYSMASAPPAVLGEQIIHPAGRRAPLAFEIRYDWAAINPSGAYAIAATITVEGELVTHSTTPVMITQNASTVEVVLSDTGQRSLLDLPAGFERLARFSH